MAVADSDFTAASPLLLLPGRTPPVNRNTQPVVAGSHQSNQQSAYGAVTTYTGGFPRHTMQAQYKSEKEQPCDRAPEPPNVPIVYNRQLNQAPDRHNQLLLYDAHQRSNCDQHAHGSDVEQHENTFSNKATPGNPAPEPGNSHHRVQQQDRNNYGRANIPANPPFPDHVQQLNPNAQPQPHPYQYQQPTHPATNIPPTTYYHYPTYQHGQHVPVVLQPRVTYVPSSDYSHTYTKYKCDGEFYRNQLFISIVFVVCGVLCLNILPCAVAACIYSIKTADANKENRTRDAQKYHRQARCCNIAVMIMGFVGLVLFIAVVVTVLRVYYSYII